MEYGIKNRSFKLGWLIRFNFVLNSLIPNKHFEGNFILFVFFENKECAKTKSIKIHQRVVFNILKLFNLSNMIFLILWLRKRPNASWEIYSSLIFAVLKILHDCYCCWYFLRESKSLPLPTWTCLSWPEAIRQGHDPDIWANNGTNRPASKWFDNGIIIRPLRFPSLLSCSYKMICYRRLKPLNRRETKVMGRACGCMLISIIEFEKKSSVMVDWKLPKVSNIFVVWKK